MVSIVFAAAVLLGAGPSAAPGEPPRFERDVLPILKSHCLKCHGATGKKGGLSLRSPSAMREGGDSGPALVNGNLEESFLVEQIESGAMPPGKAAKLSTAEVDTIKRWIAAGAPSDSLTAGTTDEEPEHWAFKPPQRPDVPRLADPVQTRNPIDAFLKTRLAEKGLNYAPPADRLTLIRRATLDLWGLPPSPSEIDAFLAETSDGAYERLIDRLLASPKYGERWGRIWLDLAGYADSEGILSADYVRSAAWRYRDWVVRAFNGDVPYDRFLREQIAGDEYSGYWDAYRAGGELSPQVVDSLVATGYLRCASDTSRPDFVNIKNAQGYYYQTLDDTVKIVASSVLGVTLQCARCHTHKYDPITQADYYRFQAIFMSGYRPDQWIPQVERRRFEATEATETEAKAHNATIDASIARRTKDINAITALFGDRRFADRLEALPAPIREDVRTAFATAPDKQNEVQRYLLGKFQPELRPSPPELAKRLAEESPRDRDLVNALQASNAADEASRRTFAEIRAFYDLPGEPKTPILRRGDYLTPGPLVEPGALPSLAAPRPFQWSEPGHDAPTSGRRRALADWLTQPGHPLTARVLVNRLWLQHFGEGIVATPENFGVQGAAPSHPRLLDWLATEFVAQGWSVKAMHRLIMTTDAYRQSSYDDPERRQRAHEADPDNRLIWRQRVRRVEAEVLRDAILTVAGTLNFKAGGPPVPVVLRPDGEVVAPDGPEGLRRSIYLQVRRSQPLTLLQVFDQPVMETNCTRRVASTVSSQALTLLNSDFLSAQASAFADRVLRESPNDPTGFAVRLAYGRPASDAERTLFNAYLAEQAERSNRGQRAALVDVCQMILGSNEFAYID